MPFLMEKTGSMLVSVLFSDAAESPIGSTKIIESTGLVRVFVARVVQQFSNLLCIFTLRIAKNMTEHDCKCRGSRSGLGI